MDTVQFILLFVIVIFTLLLVILGVQVYFILKDVRRTINKANKVLDDTSVITEAVSEPVANLSTLVTGVKAGAVIAKLLKGSKHKEDKDGE